jgi:hypothetical protein
MNMQASSHALYDSFRAEDLYLVSCGLSNAQSPSDGSVFNAAPKVKTRTELIDRPAYLEQFRLSRTHHQSQQNSSNHSI